jgi:hypothetical protein
MLGRRASGETRDRQIRDALEEMNGAALADEAGTEFAEHPIGLHECAPEPVGVLRVVRRITAEPLMSMLPMRHFVFIAASSRYAG